MSTATLFEIKDDLDALAALLYETGGDVTDEVAAAAVDAWLAETGEALKDKLDRYGSLIREKEGLAALRKQEAERLAGLASADLNVVKRLKERLMWFFGDQQIEKVETPRFKFAIQDNGGRPPVHILVDPVALPEWARRVAYSADTDAIREKLENGADIDFAQIGERGRHLRIR
jgi:hypothetical protein